MRRGASRVRVVLFTMGVISATAALVSMLVLYFAGAKQQRLHLQALVKSQASLIEAVARFDAVESQDANPEGAWAATLSQVAAGHAEWHALHTGVSLLIVGENDGELVVHVQDGMFTRPAASTLPKRPNAAQAFEIEHHSELEYRADDGRRWFEVGEPIPALRMAVLGRLDLDVVNGPLRQALQVSAAASIVLILMGVFLVRNTSVQTVHQLRKELSRRRVAEAKLSRHQAELEATVAERTSQLERAHQELLDKERFATLGQVTATVSHELRNPLGTIRTTLHTLRLRVGESLEGVGKLFERLDRNVMRCDRIIEELLSYTRMREPLRERVDLTQLLSLLLCDYKPAHPLSVDSNLQSGVHIFADPEDVRRIVVNLLNNAVDATGANGPAIRLDVESVDAQVLLRVEDKGVGMSQDILNKAFEPLFSTKGFGVGLGLPIVKELVTRNEGTLELKSEQGSGTCAVVRFPTMQAASGALSPPKSLRRAV